MQKADKKDNVQGCGDRLMDWADGMGSNAEDEMQCGKLSNIGTLLLKMGNTYVSLFKTFGPYAAMSFCC